MRRFRCERGQTFVLAALLMLSLLGMAALVVDAGSWFRAHRKTQSIADAAALAGAQQLPDSLASASSTAITYANQKNNGAVASGDVTFETDIMGNDTIAVHATRQPPGFFAKIAGVDSVSVGATAKAQAYNLEQAHWSAPFGVDKQHSALSGPGCPCYGQNTVLELNKVGPGAFRVLNVDGSQGGTGSQTLADWILNGFGGYMGLGWYWSDPGAKFNSDNVEDALDARKNTIMLFPVYDQVQGQGANFKYQVVGWAGFFFKKLTGQGNNVKLEGYFTHVVWEGIESEDPGQDYFGAITVKLVE